MLGFAPLGVLSIGAVSVAVHTEPLYVVSFGVISLRGINCAAKLSNYFVHSGTIARSASFDGEVVTWTNYTSEILEQVSG